MDRDAEQNKPVLNSITDDLREANTSVETLISLELNTACSDVASRSGRSYLPETPRKGKGED